MSPTPWPRGREPPARVTHIPHQAFHSDDEDDDIYMDDESVEVSVGRSTQTNVVSKADTPRAALSLCRNRLISFCLGMSILLCVILGFYYAFHEDEDEESVQQGRSANFQGIMALEAVAQHSEPEDCWLALHESVYDLTNYAPEHPGGPEYIWDYCGQNATTAYQREHTKSLLDLIPETLLGTLGEEENAPEESDTEPVVDNEKNEEQDNDSIPEDSDKEEDKEQEKDKEPEKDTNEDKEQEKDKEPEKDTNEDKEQEKDKEPEKDTNEDKDQEKDAAKEPEPVVQTDSPTPAPTSTRCFEQYYDISTVSQHATEDDCWYILYDSVFDVTNFADEHPGGSRRIFNECGTDATETYQAQQGHDEDLLVSEQMHRFRLGTAGDVTEKKTVSCPSLCEKQVYSLATVAQHDNVDDCWYVLYDAVYDLTDYVYQHPGGARRIFNECGTDATSTYEAERKHDQDLLEKEGMDFFKLGSLGSSTGTRYVPC